jgi:DNA repair protein RadC
MPTTLHPPLHRRPRERLWEHGPSQLSLVELLSIILGSGCAEHSVYLLSQSIANLLQYGPVSLQELARIPGIGPAKAAVVSAALELHNALKREVRPTLLSAQEVYAACSDLLDHQQEHLLVFHLSSRSQAMQREIVTIGTATASLVHPREIFRSAIIHNASAIILVHNHPSGDPTPSEADFQATKRVYLAGRELGIDLIDHVICARSGFTSLREQQPKLFL